MSAGIDLAVDLSRTVIYLWNGYLDKKYFWFIPVMLVVAYAGVWFGKQILNKIPQEIFKRIVLLMILLVGCFMIGRFFQKIT